MKITFLGTCSGTEPQINKNYTSIAFEINGYLYLFDAGEGCAKQITKYGLDFTNIRTVFISHPHFDHTAGLPVLLHTIQKLVHKFQKTLKAGKVSLFAPVLDTLNYAKKLAFYPESEPIYAIFEEHAITSGIVYKDENLTVSAIKNNHLPENSYSFLIETENEKIVYSGDVSSPSDLDSIAKNCDVLLMETGHHKIINVLNYASDNGVKTLFLMHHGREILHHREKAQRVVDEFIAKNKLTVKISKEGEVFEIE